MQHLDVEHQLPHKTQWTPGGPPLDGTPGCPSSSPFSRNGSELRPVAAPIK